MKGNWKHGHARAGINRSPEYGIWFDIIRRCENEKVKGFIRYGARGIKVCARWKNFENFLKDMGHRPAPDLTVERIDNDGNYSKTNCRWATRSEQARNRKSNRIVNFFGEQITLVEASERCGVKLKTLWMRLHYGKTGADLFAPTRR